MVVVVSMSVDAVLVKSEVWMDVVVVGLVRVVVVDMVLVDVEVTVEVAIA